MNEYYINKEVGKYILKVKLQNTVAFKFVLAFNKPFLSILAAYLTFCGCRKENCLNEDTQCVDKFITPFYKEQ